MVQTLLIIFAGLCLGGCDRETNAPETLDHHVWVDLTDTWDNTPWEPKRDERGVRLPQPEHVRIATTFNLPPDLIGHGSILNLYGLSWTAKVSVNGISLDTITGGPGRTEVDLGSKLRAGKNTIELDITGAKDTPALLVGHSDKEAKVVFPPQLLLRPRVGLDHVVASLTQSGLRLQATTRHAPNGTQVHFEGWRDGEQFADWGNALVHNDQAILDAGEWSGPLWPGDPGESPLFMLKATLISDQGVVLDSGSWRTGLRRFEVSNNHTQLNGKNHRLLGLRQHDSGFVRGMQVMTPTGLNLIEFHGQIPTPAELQMADELGVSLAILPRCDGRINADLEHVKSIKSELHAQDDAIMKQTAHAPSVVIWSTEGSALNRKGYSVARPLVANMLNDPLPRLVAGWDMPVFAIPATGPDEKLNEERQRSGVSNTAPFWVLEFHLNDKEPDLTMDAIGKGVERSFNIGALGGVLPGAEEGNPEWAPKWSQYTRKMNIPPLKTQKRRSTSRVQINGLTEGEMVSIIAPGAPHKGVVAGANKQPVLTLWHKGSAEIRSKNGAHPVTLHPGHWEDIMWSGQPTEINIGNHP